MLRFSLTSICRRSAFLAIVCTIGNNDFDLKKKKKVRTHGWMQNWILRHIYKIHFRLFGPFFCGLNWLKSLQKVLIWPQNYVSKYFQYGYQKTQILMPLLNLLKINKRVYTKKVRGQKTFVHSIIKVKNVHNFCTFMLNNYFVGTFYTFFNGFEISIKFGVFWYPYRNVVNFFCVGILSLFTNSEA